MHDEPGRAWRLTELAKAAGMSRARFAQRFKAAAGVPPLGYLTDWRMRMAQRRLREETVGVIEIARSLGYKSESAFSHAFKRVTGIGPRAYRMLPRSARRSRKSSIRAHRCRARAPPRLSFAGQFRIRKEAPCVSTRENESSSPAVRAGWVSRLQSFCSRRARASSRPAGRKHPQMRRNPSSARARSRSGDLRR